MQAYAEKLAINEAYVRDVGLGIDLRLVAGTIVWMLRGKGWDWKPAPVRELADSDPQPDANAASSSAERDERKVG